MIAGLLGRLFRLGAELRGEGRESPLATVGGELVRLEQRRRQRPRTASR